MNSKKLGWLFLLFLAFLVSGCSLKFSLSPAKTAPSGVYHTVQRGETLWRISQAYNSSVSTIKNANNLKSDEIKVNQRLLIPHAKETKKIPPASPSQIEQPVWTRSSQPPKPSVIVKPVPKKTTGLSVFSWPLAGKVLSTAEEAAGEKKISIEGKPGERIITSRAGQTFFTGETKGYSSTLIVDHLDGFYSVYGGDIEITVHKGDKLTENGIIGKMSSTREKPKLFFEIRRGTEAVNPLVYLKQ